MGKENTEKVGRFKKAGTSIFGVIRSSFVTGLFVIAPVLLSLWVAWIVYIKLTEIGIEAFTKWGLMPGEGAQSFWMMQGMRVSALVIIIVILCLIGLLAKLTLGRKLIGLTQFILLKLPIINFIYSTCKQIGDALWKSKNGGMFSKAVLFEYPRKGCYAVGFLTNENKDCSFEINDKVGTQMISIFIPTTPNPTSGFLMFVPKNECIFLDMSVADAMKLIVSCGAVMPGQTEKKDEIR